MGRELHILSVRQSFATKPNYSDFPITASVCQSVIERHKSADPGLTSSDRFSCLVSPGLYNVMIYVNFRSFKSCLVIFECLKLL